MRTKSQVTTACMPWRVVVVDDNPEDRVEIRRLLLRGSDRRYTFAEAETGGAGIQLCRSAANPPDCLLLDYNLPDMDATEVLAALTGPDGLPNCPVVVLTGGAASEAGRAVLRAGAQDYIGKDWLTPEALTRVCENAIERWAMTWDLRDRENRLRASEMRLRLFIDHAPAAIAMLDRDMCYLAVSRRWREDYGLGELDVIGRSHYEVFPDLPDRWRVVHQQALAGQVVIAAEDRFERPDRSIAWLKWEVRPWPDHAGNVGGIIIFTEDITERKKAEDDLRVTTERFQAAIQASHVVVFNQDRDLRYTWIQNPQLWYAETEIIGRRDSDFFPRAEDAARLESIKRAVMESAVGQRHEVAVLHEGVMHYYDLMVQPQRNAGGAVIGVTCAGVDITERKGASAALQDSEERLRLSLDAADAGMWELVPATGEFIASDRAGALHGLPPGTPLTLDRAVAAVCAEDRQRIETALRHTLDSGKPFAIEVRVPQPDGSIRWLASRAELSSGLDHPRLVGLVQDITARKQVESNLAFLAEISEAFTPAATTKQIARIAAQKIIRHFDASRVNFSDVSASGDKITVFYSQREEHLREDRISHRLSEYLSNSLIGQLRAGQTVAVSDVQTDPQTSAHAAAYLQWNIGSMILAPHVSEGQWKFLIALHKGTAYSWRSDEIELLREVASRVHLRLDLARAMEALGAAHDTFRHLVENSPFGVFAVDADFRLVQVSAGAQRIFENVRPLLGRDFIEVWSVIWPEPFASESAERFRRTLETGEAYRASSTVERRRDTGEVESYDWKIERVVLPDGRCGVVCHFYDLSERQRWEAALVAKSVRKK
jgi:PAS domain S-box-containing protein